MSGSHEGFAARWSRRKQQVQAEEIKSRQVDSAANTGAVEAELEDEHAKERIVEEPTAEEKLAELNKLTDEDMPDIETLDEDSDYAGFMSANVSEGLRKMALAKLFHGKSYNIRDGLDEYDGDYTYFEKLDPNVITSDMHHMIEVEAKRALAKKEQEERQRLLAETDEVNNLEGLDELDEFDELADEAEEIGELEYVSDSISTEGFVTEVSSVEKELVEKTGKVADGVNNNDRSNNDRNNEEVA